MRLVDASALALGSLRKNPLRTLLTVLGLGVGIAAVLTVLTLGSAGEAQVEVQIDRLGVDKVWVTAEEGSSLSPGEVECIRQTTQAAACASTSTLAAASLEEKNVAVQACGYDEAFQAVHAPQLVAGRLFAAGEYTGAAVALVDETVAEALGGDVLGKRISLGHRRLLVVGVVAATAGQPSAVVLPLETFLDTYASGGISQVTINVPQGQQADALARGVLAALGDGYRASTLQKEIDAARSVVRIFVLVLTCVAAVCMLSGGIGVMNILLVSVRERRQEIGLLKAIGGTAGQVGVLFLLEAVGYALLGGVLGVALGMGLVRLCSLLIGLEATLVPSLALAAVGIAGAVGVLFGVVPALRAAALLPVDALKNH